MRYQWIVVIAIHLVPVVAAVLTWKKPWKFAFERIVRVQVIASVLYFPAFVLAGKLALGTPFQFMDIFDWFYAEGLWYTLPLVSAAAVTALVALIRRRATRGRENESV